MPTIRCATYEYELACLHCGQTLDPVAGTGTEVPTLPNGLRCFRCNGPILFNGSRRLRLVEPIIPFTTDEQPRRGRPTRAMIAARDAAARLAAS